MLIGNYRERLQLCVLGNAFQSNTIKVLVDLESSMLRFPYFIAFAHCSIYLEWNDSLTISESFRIFDKLFHEIFYYLISSQQSSISTKSFIHARAEHAQKSCWSSSPVSPWNEKVPNKLKSRDNLSDIKFLSSLAFPDKFFSSVSNHKNERTEGKERKPETRDKYFQGCRRILFPVVFFVIVVRVIMK